MPVSTVDPRYQASLEEALKACAEEQIHQLGKIQPVGVLLAVDASSLVVRMASDNLSILLPFSPAQVIGKPLADVLGSAQAQQFHKLIAQENWPGSLISTVTLERGGQQASFDMHMFRSNELVVIEIEKDSPLSGDIFHDQFIPIRDLLWKLDAEKDMQRYSQTVVEEVRQLSGYDRVMMYRFDPNWDGEVIAESLADGAVSYLGNHFPASDIPPQARELYTRNLVRLIVNVDDAGVAIASSMACTAPLDLSLSWLRSMSPVHMQYLRNMGVQATLSISLVQNNRLWGLIACHHLSAKYVPLRSREIMEFIGRMVSLKLSNMENVQRGALQDQIRVLLRRLTESIRQTNDLDMVIKTYEPEFLGLVRAGGAVISIAGVWHRLGQTLPNTSLGSLLRALKDQSSSVVYCTDRLANLIPHEKGLDSVACGLMVAPLGPSMNDFVMWFRPGLLRTLRWAGQPQKQINRNEVGRLYVSPRESFETWMETHNDKSMAWSQIEIDAANSLSLALIEVLAQKALQSSEASYRLLAENSTDLIARLDPQGLCLFISPASMDLLGVPPSAMRGRALQHWILPEDLGAFDSVLSGLRTPGDQCTALLHCKKEDGQPIWVEATLKTMQGPGGTQEIVVNARDVTQRHTYQLAIEEVHRRNGRILNASGEGLLSLDAQGLIVYANELMAQMLGVELSALMNRNCSEALFSPGAASEQQACAAFQDCLADGKSRQGRFDMAQQRGKPIRTHFVCTPLVEGLTITGAVVVFRTLASSSEESRPFTDVILEQTVEAVMVTSAAGLITSVNRAFTEITGYSAEEAIGQSPRLIKSGVHTPHFYKELWDCLDSTKRWSGEIWNRRKNGEIYPQWGSITAISNGTGSVQNYLAVFSDISKAKQAEEKLYFLANHDSLTGLPNRMSFASKLADTLERAKRNDGKIGVLFVDVDRFKLVNDTLGHASGDIYLRAIADRLLKSCRKQDMLARWGGDEFVMVLEDINDNLSVGGTIKRLQRDVGETLLLDGHQLTPTLSIGISLFPSDGLTPSDLIKAADAAMYRAKEQGRNRFAFYTEVMSHEISEKFNISAELRRAILDDELRLHYQPQVDTRNAWLVGVEALVRWQHPTRGLLPPGLFISVAEELGLIEDLGNWVLEEACRQMRAWHDQGVAIARVAVNVAPAQLNEQLLRRVAWMLQKYRLQPHCLEIEITEGALQAGEPVKRILESLRDLGVLLSIDDFGTGYSSLSHIKNFPITCFKIDKSFVDGIPGNAQDVAIVKAILTLGSSLQVEMVAEGVETLEQYNFFQEFGANTIQGYYFAKPMVAEAAAQFAAARPVRSG